MIELWFELASPYAYLSAMRLAALGDHRVAWRPFLLGPIFQELHGTSESPFTRNPARGRFMWADVERRAKAAGIPFRRPSVFPRPSLLATRIALLVEDEPWIGKFVRAVFEASFADDADIASAVVVRPLLAPLTDRADELIARAAEAETKERLRTRTAEAMARGVFGAPTFFAGGEMYWGDDQLDAALAADVTIVGRSSSQYTRVARIFAHELGVPYAFRPIFDLGSMDAATYGENPALKMPILHDAEGALFGTENICRRLARSRPDVVLRGDARVVANAEELALHVMAADVSIVLTKLAGHAPAPKVLRGLENSLAWLDAHVGEAVAALPATRALSLLEVVLYCGVTHLPFREVLDVAPYSKLTAFCDRFGERPSARATSYRFDVKA